MPSGGWIWDWSRVNTIATRNELHMMESPMETLVRGEAVVSVVCLGILIAVTLAAWLRMGAVRPRTRLSESIRRSWLGFPLLLLFVCGLVQYGSTKGTGGIADERSTADVLRIPAPTVAPSASDLTDSSLPADIPPVTNLCLWGIERGDASVALGLAWPSSMLFANGRIDVFGNHRLTGGGWWRLAQLDVSRAVSNAVVEFAYADLPTNAMCTTAFYRVASQDDADGDGLSDGVEEWVLGTDSRQADTDGDGILDGEEIDLGSSPLSADSDGDGMPDGWEVGNNLNPRSAEGRDGASGDSDGDGLCNYDEFQLGCDPNAVDSDGDGVSDFLEIRNGSNPADGTDRGVPSADFPFRALSFNVYGDYAAWRMTIAGRGPDDHRTEVVSMASPGASNEKLKILRKGNSYRLTMEWLNSEGHTDPSWYCWQAKVDGLPTSASYQSYTTTRLPGNEIVYGQGWMAENEDGLLTAHVHAREGGGGNVAEGLEALLHVYRCEVAVCAPGGEAWEEMEESRVLLDDEDLRISIRITPAISTLDLCRSVMGNNVIVSTSGTCPNGVAIPIVPSEFSNCGTHSEIRIARTRAQLAELGLLPAQDEDGVDEMASYDVGTLAGVDGSDLSDSIAFEGMALVHRGRASNERTLTLDSTPPNSELSESFFKAAGAEVLSVSYGGVQSARRQIMNQADYFYYSGHGHHRWGTVDDFEPGDVADYWRKDLDCVIFAGCSVLDINDYNNNFLNRSGVWAPEDHTASPGRKWAEVRGPVSFFGYAYTAPRDTQSADRIACEWVANRGTMGDVAAWMKANDNRNGRNACTIQRIDDFRVRYGYFKRKKGFLYNSYLQTNVIERISY